MNKTKQKGDISELNVVTKMVELGYTVSTPYGENCRYDLILDYKNNLYKVQVKTGRIKDGVVRYNNYSVTHNMTGKSKSHNYVGDIDYFAIYVNENKHVYLVKVAVALGSLRLVPAKNNQKKKIQMAEDFEIKKVLT